MPRAIWTGSISFGLVNVPVKLFTATEDRSVGFHQFEPESGERIRYQRVTEQSGQEVAYGDIVKGYELEDGSHVLITPEELEAVEPGRSRTIDIEDFIDLDDVDPVYFDKTYHLAPADQAAAKPYALLREAMKDSNRVAIARFVMRAKQSLAAIRVASVDGDGDEAGAGDVLVLETMHFGDEVRSPAAIREMKVLDDGIELNDRERAAAKSLVESLTSDWEPAKYTDTYRERVLDLVARKADGERIVTEKAEEPTASVTDLMAVLEASVNEARQKRGDAPRATSGAGASVTDYASMSKDELYEEAQRRDIDGRSKMTKDELVAALSDSAMAEAS
ncbi:Ku protein [Acidimicrobiia bacterium EGI L10123]|uniref:non-homologous end joining protein Ku n=1 Tax=Salinilacustrithrix flava TaxID=2957203 RepID=UPI003D7C2CCA|nr:Ku protein [Acidimicrobiia bacterium EGI L10123]